MNTGGKAGINILWGFVQKESMGEKIFLAVLVFLSMKKHISNES